MIKGERGMITTTYHNYIKPVIYLIGYLALALVCTGMDVKIKKMAEEVSDKPQYGSQLEKSS